MLVYLLFLVYHLAVKIELDFSKEHVTKGYSQMKRVLALQNTWDDPMGYLGEILQEYGVAYDTINAEKEPIPDPPGYDALVILGGPQHANADDQHPYLTREKELLRHIVE